MMHSDVIDVSDWEQKMTKEHPETDPLHWHRQTPEWTCSSKGGLGEAGHVRCDGHGAEKGSLFCALAWFFEHFAHDALLQEFPAPAEPIGTPEKLPVLSKIPASELKPAHYLKWLTILVGDLHQPLHWLHEHDFGRDILVRYKDEERSLLAFWEEYLPKKLPALEKGMHPDSSDKEYGSLSPRWAHKVPTELFREWAKEVAEKVCSEVYAPMTVNHADGTRIDSPFQLTDELFQKWLQLAKELTALGGERLGFVLNEIIEHKRHKDAISQGRGLPSRSYSYGSAAGPPLAEEKGSRRQHVEDDLRLLYDKLKQDQRRRSWNNFACNAAIAAVLVPSLLAFFKWHERIGGGSFLLMAKHLKM